MPKIPNFRPAIHEPTLPSTESAICFNATNASCSATWLPAENAPAAEARPSGVAAGFEREAAVYRTDFRCSDFMIPPRSIGRIVSSTGPLELDTLLGRGRRSVPLDSRGNRG